MSAIHPYIPIGAAIYDADIDDIMMMIRVHHDPEDIISQSALFNYYISKILSYWTETKNYVQSVEIESDLRNPRPTMPLTKSNIELTRSQLLKFEHQLLENVNIIQKRFARKETCDIEAILLAFSFINQVGCAYENPEFKFDYIRDFSRLYPLPNMVGFFGINTYLYAFIHNIYIIGVSPKTIFFDGHWGCPFQFLFHDINHYDYSRDRLFLTHHEPKIRENIKILYNQVLTNPNLNNLEKQCIILYLWVDIHEIYNYNFYLNGDFTVVSSKFIERMGLEPLMIETLKFIDFIQTEDNLSSLVEFKLQNNFEEDIDPAEWFARRYILTFLNIPWENINVKTYSPDF